MSSFLWHTIVDTTASQLGIHDRDESDLYKGRYNYSYQLRGQGKIITKADWGVLWPRSRGICNEDVGNVNTYMLGQDASDGGIFEAPSVSDSGVNRPYFVMGRCVNAGGSGLATTYVELYLVSNKTFVTSGYTDQNGYYQLPTPYNGQNHEIYANYSNGTYVGASVSTLTPNF